MCNSTTQHLRRTPTPDYAFPRRGLSDVSSACAHRNTPPKSGTGGFAWLIFSTTDWTLNIRNKTIKATSPTLAHSVIHTSRAYRWIALGLKLHNQVSAFAEDASLSSCTQLSVVPSSSHFGVSVSLVALSTLVPAPAICTLASALEHSGVLQGYSGAPEEHSGVTLEHSGVIRVLGV